MNAVCVWLIDKWRWGGGIGHRWAADRERGGLHSMWVMKLIFTVGWSDFCRVGNSLFVFLWESLVFLQTKVNHSFPLLITLFVLYVKSSKSKSLFLLFTNRAAQAIALFALFQKSSESDLLFMQERFALYKRAICSLWKSDLLFMKEQFGSLWKSNSLFLRVVLLLFEEKSFLSSKRCKAHS